MSRVRPGIAKARRVDRVGDKEKKSLGISGSPVHNGNCGAVRRNPLGSESGEKASPARSATKTRETRLWGAWASVSFGIRSESRWRQWQ